MNAREKQALLTILQARFEANSTRHPGVSWRQVAARIEKNASALDALAAMESSGGEPDVVGPANARGAFTFVDCAAESPAGRRSCCFDKAARTSRKEAAPRTSAMELAAAMGVTLLDEAGYRRLQTFGDFDLKTSSWVQTPPAIRALGGALFCDRRYDQVFLYHNGAQSYYAARGFRGSLEV
jgi:hypothetical protein